MNKIEHLIMCVAEEAGEIAQIAGKAGRFGFYDKHPTEHISNAARMAAEMNDLIAVIEMLQECGIVFPGLCDRKAIQAKKEKVQRFMQYAETCGTLKKETA